jgi:ubiquinone/menaquinone biosynthesis C-methylase UbiE
VSRDAQAPLLDALEAVYPAFSLLAGLELELFSHLDAPATAAELAAALGADERRLAVLLHALVAAGALELLDGRFANGPEARRYLSTNSPDYVGRLDRILGDIWAGALRTAQSVRDGRPAAEHDFHAMSDAQLAVYFEGLDPGAYQAGQALADVLAPAEGQRILDVGGGFGGLARALRERLPAAQLTLVELPAVASLAARQLERTGVHGIELQSADICRAAPEGAYDVAVLKSVLQTLSPADARAALANVRACLVPGGRLYVMGAGILEDDRVSPAAAALFNIAFINFYRDGEARTLSEHYGWLRAAGFTRVERIEIGGGLALVAFLPDD